MAKGFFGGGSGTQADPRLIEDAYDLYAIRFGLNQHYKLTDNINLDVPPFDKTGWTPIPGMFSGSLNGNEKKIFNLVINADTKDDVGLFTFIEGNFYNVGSTTYQRVFNLSIEDAVVNGRNNVGILAGHMGCRPINSDASDPIHLLLSGIHVSGSVSGLGNIGGLIGYLDCYTNSYPWRFAENCLVDVKLNLQAEVSQAGLMFGYIYSTWTGYAPLQFVDCVVRGTITCNGTPQKAQSIVYPGVNALNLDVSSCIYDSTLWPGKATAGSIGKPTEKMILKEEFPNLELKKTAAGTATWIFGFQRYPRLWFMELNNLFVVANGNYYTYDFVNKKWVKEYDRVPTKAEAVQNGMKSLDDIDRAAWDAIEIMASSMDIVNIVDKSVGITLKDNLIDLDRDASKDMPGKQIYRKEIVLSDYDHGIFVMEPK